MELRVLRYFLAVAREETITSAANLLHVTQPTLSRQIKDLEDELGQQLLIRGSHRVELTAEGMLLRKRAEEIVAMADRTEEEFRALLNEARLARAAAERYRSQAGGACEAARQAETLERLDRDTLTALVERVAVHREKALEVFFRFCRPEAG